MRLCNSSYSVSMGFKENLKSELEYQGMMVKELAYKSGINKQTIDNYLSTHNSVPNAELAVKIAQALGTSVEYLITGKTQDKSQKIENPKVMELTDCFKKLSEEKQNALLQIAKLL